MLFRNRKQNRRSNRSQQSQRRKSTTRRIQLLERLEDRRLMAVAGGFEEQLLRFELNRGEYSRSLRDQVQQDRYRPGRVELRRVARTAPAQQVDNSATDIQQPGQNEQPVSPDGDEKKPEIEKKSGDANEPNGGNETKSDSSPEGKDPTDEATAKLNELKSDAADSVKVDEIDVSELSQPSSIFEGVEWNLDRRLRTGRDAGRSRLRTDPKDELESGGEEKNPKVENETPGQKDPTEENGGNEQESSRWDLTPEEQEVLRKENGLSEDQMNELFKEGRLDLGSKTFFIDRWSDGSPTISIGIKCSFPGDWPLDGENQDPQTEPAGGTGPGEAITPEDPSTETPGDSGNDPGNETGSELGVGLKNNPNPLGNVPAKGDGQQPLVPVNPNNGAAEQTLEELQEKREELQRQHQENERQQNELEKAGEEGSFDEEKFINLLDEMHRLLVQLGELDEKILEKLYKQGAELEQQHQENERKLRELDQDGEMDAAQEAEFIELLGEMHRLRDQLQKLYEKIGGITSQNAVNGQEGPAVVNPGDAQSPQKLNFSPEEKEAFRRRFGLSEDQMDELLEEGSLKDKGRIFSVFEHADGPPLILVTEPDPGPAVDNPNDKEEKAGTPEDQKSDQKGNGDKPDDSQEPKDPDNGKKQGALDGTDKLAMLPRRIVVVDSLPPVIQLPLHPGKYESSRDPVSPDAGPNCRDFVDGQLPPESQEKTDRKDSTHYKIRYNCPDPAVPRDQAENRPVVVEDRKLPRVQVDGVNKVFSEAGFPYTDDGKVEDLPDLTDPNVPEPFGQPQPHDLIWGNVDFTKGAEKQPQGQVEKVIQPNQAKLEDGVEDRLSERETRLLESARERVTRAATEHGRAVAEANAAAEALRKCEKDVAELRDKHDASKAEVDAAKEALKKAEAELENYQSDVDAASREWDRVDRQFWAYAKYRSIVRGQDGRTSERYREAQGQLDRGNDQHNEAGRRYSEIKGSLADRQAAVAAAKENLKAAQAAEQAAQKALNAKEKECQRVDEKQGQANAAETRAAKEVDQANTAAQETATQVTKSSKLRREAAEAQERADREAARQREEDRQKAEQEKQRQEDAKDPAVKKFEAWMGKRFKALDVNDPVDRSMVARVYYAETGVLEAGVNAAALIPNIVSPPSSNGAVGIFRTIGRGLVNTFHGLKDYATGWVR